MKPKKMMKDELFWEIIDQINWKQTDNDQQVEPIIDFLSKQSTTTIFEFQESLAYKLYLLDTMQHAKNIGEYSYTGKEEDYFSVDNFLYVRCCVVANGKGYYQKALQNPSEMPKDMEYEPLLYVAYEAYARKTGEAFEYHTGCDYESCSNREGWENDKDLTLHVDDKPTNKYQIIIQFPQDFFKNFEEMVTFEDKLIHSLPNTCEVTGYDRGEERINFFVYSKFPKAMLSNFRKYLGTNKVEKKVRIAYRKIGEDGFEMLWPKKDLREFSI